MFNDLFWAIYWIDILGGLSRGLAGILLFGVVAAIASVILRDLREDGPQTRSIVIGFCLSLVVSLPMLFVPSKQTMYMMLGVKTTEHVMDSPLGKKIKQIIDLEVDGYLKKLS